MVLLSLENLLKWSLDNQFMREASFYDRLPKEIVYE